MTLMKKISEFMNRGKYKQMLINECINLYEDALNTCIDFYDTSKLRHNYKLYSIKELEEERDVLRRLKRGGD